MLKTDNLLLPKLMQHLAPEMHRLGRSNSAKWRRTFRSFFGEDYEDGTDDIYDVDDEIDEDEAPDRGNVSRLINGRRPIPHPYIKHYADIKATREPPKLLTDLTRAMATIGDVPSSTQKMIDALIVYVDTYIDPIDRPGLMPAERPPFPSQADAAKLWTRVLWYTMCHDYATT